MTSPKRIPTDHLVLTLIKAELLNTKLIIGLQQAGLGVENFYIDLTKDIFTLLGFKGRDDALYDFTSVSLINIAI